MSGHSKWSQIKRSKGAADIKKGQTFTKISNAITIAVKEGGGVTDPNQNFKLRLAVEAARSANMPNENVGRAIKRANGAGEQSSLEEVVYEGFAPGGVSVIVEAVTDNPKRTTSEVKSLFTKSGAHLATPGAVSYQFQSVGEIRVIKENQTIDEIFMKAAEAGAQDVWEGDNEFIIYTDPDKLSVVDEKLSQIGIILESSQLSKKPTVTVAIPLEKKDSIINFLNSLQELDDVHKVYSNLKA